jgi:hypothetical protein
VRLTFGFKNPGSERNIVKMVGHLDGLIGRFNARVDCSFVAAT